MKRTAVFLCAGFEELEAVSIIDLLRRAGFICDMVGLETLHPTGSHGITLTANLTLEELEGDYDLLALPGGMPGSAALAQSLPLRALLRRQNERGGLLAAVCAAPIALADAGILTGRRATVYPGYEDRLTGARVLSDSVVRDGNIITGRGPGLALAFSLALVEALGGDTKALASQLLVG